MVNSHKEAQKRLNELIEAKLNDKTPTTLKSLTFHDHLMSGLKDTTQSRFKQSTVTTKSYKIAHQKKY